MVKLPKIQCAFCKRFVEVPQEKIDLLKEVEDILKPIGVPMVRCSDCRKAMAIEYQL